jgi:hypothetical protein
MDFFFVETRDESSRKVDLVWRKAALLRSVFSVRIIIELPADSPPDVA